MVPEFKRQHFLNKSIGDSTDDELIDALNKCYVGMQYFPIYDGSIIGTEIRHCANMYEKELYLRGRSLKLVFDNANKLKGYKNI